MSATIRLAVGVTLATAIASPASADPISITQQRALTGGISSGDQAGYPISITDPGSYRLDSDLYSSTVAVAILVASPNLTLDFNGFRLAGFDGTTNGIVTTQPGLTVKNGTITNFLSHGIFADNPANFLTVENMKIQNIDGAPGAAVRCSAFCVVRRSIVTDSNNGIDAPGSTLVEDNTVAFNSGFQIRISTGLIRGNMIVGALPITGTGPLVGYGDNTIVSSDSPTGVSPLVPNACSPAC